MRNVGRAHVINGRTGGTPGPATTTPTTVDIPGDVANRTFNSFFRIRHLSGEGLLRVGIDSQAYITLKPDEIVELPVSVTSLSMSCSAGTVEYEGLVIV